MARTGFRVVVDDHDIIITEPDSHSGAVYFKPRGKPYIVARNSLVGTQE